MASERCWICNAECSTEDNFCRICGAELTHQTGPEPTRIPTDRHLSIGIFLLAFGGITAGLSLLIGVIPTLALGLATLLIGIMTLYLPEPTERLAERLASDSSVSALLNVENLLDDLALNEKGVYIPATGLGVCPKVFMPLTLTPVTRRPPLELNNTRRVFITLDEKARGAGLLLEIPGRNLLSELEQSLKLDFSKVSITDLREKLESGLRLLDIAKSLVLDRKGDLILTFEIELTAFGSLDVKLSKLTPRVFDQIGTPVPSAIAAAVSKSTTEYVTFKQISVNPTGKKITATVELLH